MNDLDQIVRFVSSAGVTGVLIVLIWGLSKGWFVTGREHAAVLDQLKDIRADVTRLRERDDGQQRQIDELQGELATARSAELKAVASLAARELELVALRERHNAQMAHCSTCATRPKGTP